jgi:hypothetical protein
MVYNRFHCWWCLIMKLMTKPVKRNCVGFAKRH